MNLSKIEKIIIMVLVVGGILALGIIFLCKPAYESIGKAENNLKSAQNSYNDLMARLERLNTIDDDIKAAKDAIVELEDDFYPDLTSYEAVEIALAHIKDFDLKTYGVTVSGLTTTGIGLEYYTQTPVIYNLKTYAQNAAEAKEGEIVLLEGQFLDDDKVYTVNVASVANITITDENGEVVEIADYTDTMAEAHKEALCRFAATNNIGQTVSATTVNFTIKGEYKNYLDFVNYIHNFSRATRLNDVQIPVSMLIYPDDDGKYFDADGKEIKVDAGTTGNITIDYDDDTEIEQNITLTFLGVEQIEELESLDINGVEIVTNQNPN